MMMMIEKDNKTVNTAQSSRNLMSVGASSGDYSMESLGDDAEYDDDDDASFFASSRDETSRGDGTMTKDELAGSETRIILALRCMIIVILMVTGSMTAASLYLSNERYQASVSSEFAHDAATLIQGAHGKLVHMLQVIDDMAAELSTRGGSDWPFVTFDDFERDGTKKRAHAGVRAIMLLPLVETTKLPEWRNYTTAKRQSLREGINERDTIIGYAPGPPFEKFRAAVVDTWNDALANSSGPSLPLWQITPSPTDATLYNMDMMKVAGFAKELGSVVKRAEVVIGSSVDPAAVPNGVKRLVTGLDDSDKASSEPFATVWYPIASQSDASKVVGVLGALFRWSDILADSTLPKSSRVVAVIDKNGTSMPISYPVNGEQVTFLDESGANDSLYHDEVVESSRGAFNAFVDKSGAVAPINELQSRFTIRVHQAAATKSSVFPQVGALYAAIVAVMFTLMTALFYLYDIIVQRRQKEVHDAAIRSNKIVTSLFPIRVADRLFNTEDACSNAVEHDEQEEFQVKKTFLSQQDGSSQGLIKEPANHKLKHVLKDNGHIYDDLVTSQSDKPIADFFPACTVLFADIAGFTAFASERPPEQVFELLQNVYQAFDKAARKRHVFKVETIGDCYLAVTGLPDPQPNHAVIMTGFALHCRAKMKEVTRKLERTLGPDTSSLVMRFGLHSGPVIAGVLRGERARFQLFGDTVNTAARMESTGAKDRIQVSEATANLLIEAGKGSWVTPREELVSVKGKGQMKTFWLESRDVHMQRTKLMSQVSIDSFDGSLPDQRDPKQHWEALASKVVGRDAMKVAKQEIWARSEVDMPPQTTLKRCSSDATSRLIDWNTQILLTLLKPVVAHRQATKGTAFKADEDVAMPFRETNEGTALDEIREIIELPSLDPSKSTRHIDPESVEMDIEVECQLRDFVTGIASMYRDNPFHNYAHACHVQMSMIKLLQRVVSPDSVNYRGAQDAIASAAHNYTFGITSSPLTSFAVVFSALIHDVDHCGVTNGQLVKENAPVATFYQGKSVAEQNSIDLAWEMLMQPNFKELRGCIFADQSELARFRQLVVNIVLATDIFDKELSALRKDRWNKAFSEESLSEPLHIQVNRKATIVLEHLIQASDVSHTMQHFEIYKKWNEKLFYEQYIAFQTGRVDVDPSVGWYKGEIWFFDNYVIPLAKKLKDCCVFGVSSDECLNYALENRRIWVERGEVLVKEMLATDYFAKLDDAKKHRRSRRKQNKLDISLH